MKKLLILGLTAGLGFTALTFARKNSHTLLMTPSEVVEKAYRNLMDRKFSENLKLTEFAEKRRTKKLIDDYDRGGESRDEIDAFLGRVVGFKIRSEEIYGDLAVVTVEWKVRNIPTTPLAGMKIVQRGKEINTYTIDYLLKKFGAEWKIISRRGR